MIAKALLLFCLAGALPAQDLKLVPAPRSVARGQGALVLGSPVRIALASSSAEDRFAAGLLVEDWKSIHGLDASVGSAGTVLIGRPGNPRVDRELVRRKLDVSALGHEENYLLDVDSAGVLLAAKTAAGLFYGVQTLRQLTGPGARIPAVRISDWPALRYRMLSVDLNRGPLLTEEQLKSAIRTAAEYKLNMLSLYLEHVFVYAHSPMATPPGGQVTPEQIGRLSEYARTYHVELVPHQQLFGHLHNMLKFELYSDLGEIPHGSVLSPANTKSSSAAVSAMKRSTRFRISSR
jgi:N-acetyl-beta-hexosaminidase